LAPHMLGQPRMQQDGGALQEVNYALKVGRTPEIAAATVLVVSQRTLSNEYERRNTFWLPR
jgi:hypothetical protein